MEDKPTIHIPHDVHLTYDGLNEFMKDDVHITTPPPSILSPIPEESADTCECNSFNPDCATCRKHAVNYSLYLEHLNHDTRNQLKEITNAYNSLRASLPETLMTYYNDGFTHGFYTATATLAVFSTTTFFILKYFNR